MTISRKHPWTPSVAKYRRCTILYRPPRLLLPNPPSYGRLQRGELYASVARPSSGVPIFRPGSIHRHYVCHQIDEEYFGQGRPFSCIRSFALWFTSLCIPCYYSRAWTFCEGRCMRRKPRALWGILSCDIEP